MPIRRRSARRANDALPLQRTPHRRSRALSLAIAALIVVMALAGSLYLRALSCRMAVSDAKDAVILAVNGCVNRVILENDYSYEDFVTLEKEPDGTLTAIKTNAMQINVFSSQLLSEMVKAADSETLNLRIPLGNLLGLNLLSGRGPKIPVEIIMLTSSFVRLDNALESTGINQSRHALKLKANVDVDILIPWATVSTTVETDVLIAETVIVGRVPETYVHVTEDSHGSK